MFFINRLEKVCLWKDDNFKLFVQRPYRLIDWATQGSIDTEQHKRVKRYCIPYSNYYDKITFKIKPQYEWTIQMPEHYELQKDKNPWEEYTFWYDEFKYF